MKNQTNPSEGLPMSSSDAALQAEKELVYRSLQSREALHRRIENDFMHHPPQNEETVAAYHRIRELGRGMAHELVELVPPGRELARALSDLEDVVMHSNAGLARSGGVRP